MGSPMIENSDRGITLNKQLAWTILVALVLGSMWVGSTVTGLQNSTENLIKSLAEMSAKIESEKATTANLVANERQFGAALEARIRALEVTSTRQDARFDALSRSLEEVKSAQRESNDLLRQIIAAEKK